MSELSPIGGAGVFDLTTRVQRTRRSRFNSDVSKRPRWAQPAPAPVPAKPTPTVTEARARMHSAADALRGAFDNLTRRTYSVRSSEWIGSAGVSASVTGGVNSLGTYSTLAGTREVNEQTSTVRTSANALGLEISSLESASRIGSTGTIGLDLTSPTRASILGSSAMLGLDVTSATSASQLHSNLSLGLDVTSPQASSTLVSTEEVNTAATSYAPSVSFSSGTSVATLSGTYNGANSAAAATSLQIKITQNATLGPTATAFAFEVLDQTGAKLFEFGANYKAGDKLYLGDDIGLQISFSAGTTVNDQIGTSAVSHTSTSVDPAALFNADNPNLRPRFDQGAQITDGSFKINGTSIAVNANDSINSVIARINSSAAGVTASFANDKLTLTTNGNSEDHIYLSNDTSGFLSAMKLTAPNEEINAATTSYGSKTLTFGLSSSVGTLSGTYLGTGAFAEATSLKIKLRNNNLSFNSSTASALKFDVLDQNDDTLFTFDSTAKAGDKIALGTSGLKIQFSAGTLILSSIGSTTVSTTTKTDVDAAATFNHSVPNLRPWFENEAQVTAGSFQVNGTSVAVNANDSINSVLARINATVSGVTASFANDKISIVNNSGSNPVVLGNDTSGFLAATKLSAAVTTKGNVRDDEQVLAKTSQFGSVTNGSFTINGVAIDVDRDTDTLQSLLAKINNSAAGVSATYDSSTDKLSLTSLVDSEDNIAVSDDTTGFLTAAKLSTNNTVRGNVRDDLQVLAKTSQFGSVTNGSFTINGVAIDVDRDTDTLQSLLAKINNSAAGVSASYDSTTDKLSLTSLVDSEDNIAVSNDTTGFLTAAKLSTDNTVRGNVRDDLQVLAKTSQFGSVTNGSFTINGVAINVDRNTDTLQSLLAKINTSAAGVSASYDESTDEITLTTNFNTEDDIVLANDSSGFLAAAKLDNASTVRGNLRDDQQVLAKTTQFSGVTNGSFSLNGVDITVNTATDSLATVLSRINNAGTGVSATYDEAEDKLVFTPDTPGATLVLENDTTGFLAAANIATGASGTRVNPDSAFNATGATAPLLEEGRPIVAGSFQVNGAVIDVAADDTLNSVLAKITASNAGVTASFDSATERVTLTSKSPGAGFIAVGGDSSGFLSAVKLDGTASSTPGASTLDSVLASSSVFDAVTNGIITINGQSLAVNRAVHTLSDVTTALNDLRGVSATLDPSTGQLLLRAEKAGGALEIEDTSGLLNALGIASGKVEGKASTLKRVEADTGRLALDDPNAVAQAIASAVSEVNDALDQLNRARYASPVFQYDAEFATRSSVLSVLGASAKGLALADDSGALKVNVKVDELARALSEDPNAVDALLSGPSSLPSSLDGLLAKYDDTTSETTPYPETASKAAGPDASNIQFGEKTLPEIAQLHDERQLMLLHSALVRPASLEFTSPFSRIASGSQPSEQSNQIPALEKLKKTYGLTAESEEKSKLPESETPWLNRSEPQDLLSTAKVQNTYASNYDWMGTGRAAGRRLLPPQPESSALRGGGWASLNLLAV